MKLDIHTDDIYVRYCTVCKKLIDKEYNCLHWEGYDLITHKLEEMNLTEYLNKLKCD